jgi:integrase
MNKGSISKRGDKYQITVDVGRDPLTGRRKRRYGTFRTKKEAETAIAEIVAEVNKGTYVDETKSSLVTFLEDWLNATSRHIRPTTEYVYRNYIKLLSPHLPEVKAKDLTKLQAEALINNLLNHYKPSTVAVCKRLLTTAFKKGVEWELIAKNPFSGIKVPQDRQEYSIWEPEEVERFLDYVKDTCENNKGNWSYFVAFMLAVHTGMRKSEILALRWENVDLNERAIHVKESIHQLYGQGEQYVGKTKSKSSRRTILISDKLVAELVKHKKRQANVLPPPNDLIVTTKEHRPIHQRNLTQAMYRAIVNSGVPKIRFHDLRHTHASLLLANGINPKVIQERLGHAKIDTTMNIYSHVFPSMQREAADKIDALLSAKMSVKPQR